ncbi:hypothetical protein GUJ93_ZPchr0012g21356 [Zizania palustris]|uniref:Uncharacterized protein n=1 Tax=Zizania palustris TaxID=103762 RepID=A0A8J6BWK6_ZIZPA|nr:hypothetical protein GUJ93_ZPchr0012g21356 [Zizania palustris]
MGALVIVGSDPRRMQFARSGPCHAVAAQLSCPRHALTAPSVLTTVAVAASYGGYHAMPQRRHAHVVPATYQRVIWRPVANCKILPQRYDDGMAAIW